MIDVLNEYKEIDSLYYHLNRRHTHPCDNSNDILFINMWITYPCDNSKDILFINMWIR